MNRLLTSSAIVVLIEDWVIVAERGIEEFVELVYSWIRLIHAGSYKHSRVEARNDSLGVHPILKPLIGMAWVEFIRIKLARVVQFGYKPQEQLSS